MDRPGHENTHFFVGTEVEQTPAFGRRTLFVVGVQDVTAIHNILKAQNTLSDPRLHIGHIYFGANHSFPKLDINDAPAWRAWESMIAEFLKAGFLCTLDLDVNQAEGLVESGLIEYNNFIPMISVKLPYIQLLGYNAVVKLDDKDFAKTNPGVWCHSLHELRDRKKFTDWSRYTKDETL
jgi:hypothetical protein